MWHSGPQQSKLALRTWIVISLVGEEPELLHKVERYRLGKVGLTSTHVPIMGSGASLLEKDWILFHSGSSLGEKCWYGEGLLIPSPGFWQ